MVHRPTGAGLALTAVLAGAAAFASDPVDARCSTTDDGVYRCQFHLVDGSGSFQVSAPGKPTYVLNVTEPGVAYGFTVLESHSVPLPGRYLRSKSDRACWENDTTKTEICVW